MTRLANFLKLSGAVLALFIFVSAEAQDEGFIYGRVTTEDGDTYEGPLRWGKEEVYWTDMFNASKRKNENLDYLTNRELDDLEDRYNDRNDNLISRFVNITWDDDNNGRFVHEFSTEFGNLKALRIRSNDRVEVELKNGDYIQVDGSGYNDVGAKITILDQELGNVRLSWSNLDRIDFLPTPSRLDEKFGNPLYGTVVCDLGEFTGFVQWDHDERVGTDVLGW